MKKICDLHTHSNYSDGSYTPGELIDSAVELGLSAIALCDHNTVDGLTEFLAAAEGKNIEAVAGAEFSVDYNGTELHLLGLFLPSGCFSQVSDLMTEVIKRKEKSNIDLIDSLNKDGFSLDYDKIKAKTPNGNFNRSHIADEILLTSTKLKSKKELFETILSPEYGYYKEPERISVFEMIDFIKKVDGVPVLAHPFLNLSEAELIEFLPLAKKQGLVGMESLYSLYDISTAEKALRLVNEFCLLPSGGSDFHGDAKSTIHLGSGEGNLEIPYAWAEALKCCIKN